MLVGTTAIFAYSGSGGKSSGAKFSEDTDFSNNNLVQYSLLYI